MKKYNFNIGTTFQKIVWNTIAKIPKGKVLTYQELAIEIGHPKSFRAVASACVKTLMFQKYLVIELFEKTAD